MTGLAIIVVGGDRERALAAIELAAAAAALGRAAALFFRAPALTQLAVPELETARALGVRVTACATGLADHGRAAPPGVETGGMVQFLADNPDAQLLAV